MSQAVGIGTTPEAVDVLLINQILDLIRHRPVDPSPSEAPDLLVEQGLRLNRAFRVIERSADRLLLISIAVALADSLI